jgi:signal transduction histidine kinase
MSDTAAVTLGEWFLSDTQNRSIQALEEILQSDPPLAVWVAWKADTLATSPLCLSDLANLLAEYGLTWLQWPIASLGMQIDSQWKAEIPAARAAFAVLISKLAGDLASAHGESARRQAELLGLLHDPQQWLGLCESEGGEDAGPQPGWLGSTQFDPAAVAAVEAAIASIPVAPRSEGVMFGYFQRCREFAARWAALQRAAGWLPVLTARLARLAILERSLGEAVEAEKIAALAEFAAGAGHEINNPLAVIAGRAQLLLQDESDPERRRDLAVVNSQAMRVHEMIADLRLFANPPELERETVDLNVLVRRLIDELQPLAAEQETALVWIAAPNAIHVQVDPVQMSVALRSLCQNAFDALGHRGRIEITVGGAGAEAWVTVSDDGPGILPEHRPHIFEPFYSARQAGRGVGMGLSKCWRIVTLHAGRIEVGCSPACGAVFTIHLPLSLPNRPL